MPCAAPGWYRPDALTSAVPAGRSRDSLRGPSPVQGAPRCRAPVADGSAAPQLDVVIDIRTLGARVRRQRPSRSCPPRAGRQLKTAVARAVCKPRRIKGWRHHRGGSRRAVTESVGTNRSARKERCLGRASFQSNLHECRRRQPPGSEPGARHLRRSFRSRKVSGRAESEMPAGASREPRPPGGESAFRTRPSCPFRALMFCVASVVEGDRLPRQLSRPRRPPRQGRSHGPVGRPSQDLLRGRRWPDPQSQTSNSRSCALAPSHRKRWRAGTRRYSRKNRWGLSGSWFSIWTVMHLQKACRSPDPINAPRRPIRARGGLGQEGLAELRMPVVRQWSVVKACLSWSGLDILNVEGAVGGQELPFGSAAARMISPCRAPLRWPLARCGRLPAVGRPNRNPNW